MLVASLIHLTAGLLFGALGFRVQVLLFYGGAAIVVLIGAALGTNLTTSAAVGHGILALFVVSFGYWIGASVVAWRARARNSEAVDAKDRLPRLFGGAPWPSIGGGI